MTVQRHTAKQWQVLFDRLYDAVGREQRLSKAMGDFRPLFGAQASSFFTMPDPARPHAAHSGAEGLPAQSLVEYHTHFSVHDEWVKAALRRPDFGAGAVYRGQADLMSLPDVLETYFGRQFVARYQFVDVLSAVVETVEDDGALSWASFFRVEGQPGFTEDDAVHMAELVAHLRQVLRLHRRLAPQLAIGATLREVVERMQVPVFFVTGAGSVVDRNGAALSALDGSSAWLRERAGELHVYESRRWRPLSTWLSVFFQGHRQTLVLDLHSPDGRSSSLEIVPIDAAFTDTAAAYPAVAICTLKLGRRDKSQALRMLHGLTPSEARVAQQLAEGLTVDEIAASAGVATSTVRSQLAAIRGKLNVRRQAQLVAAVLSL